MMLSVGAISKIYSTSDTTLAPTVQVIDLKKISTSKPGQSERYRLVVSDSQNSQNAMLATQLNQKVINQQIVVNSIVRLDDYICNEIGDKKLIIILGLTPVGASDVRIGNPQSIDGAKTSAPPVSNNRNAIAPTNAYGAPPPPSSAPGSNWNTSTPTTNASYNRNNTPYRGSSGAMTPAAPTQNSQYRPIQNINPYQSGWTIRGRCTYKGDLRRYQNQRGEGQVISFELTDESGSIRITAFTELAPRVQETIMMGRLYSVRQGNLKHANEKWNRSTSQYEMTLDGRSEFIELPDDGNTIKVKYNFTKIADLERIENKGSCDVIGIVQTVGPLGEVILRSSGEPCPKRSVTLCDDSGASVELTLWRNQAQNFVKEEDQNRHPVMLMKNAVRGDFGGVCLNANRDTAMELDPVNIPEANALRAWYDSRGGASQAMTQMTAGRGGGAKITGERKSLEDARNEDIDPAFNGGGGSQATFIARGFVSFIKSDSDMSYPSDPDTKKKVAQVSPGLWHSPSTDRQLRDEEVVHRYIMNLKIADHTGSQWLTAFDESGAVILGRSAGEMRDLKENDRAMYDSVVDDAKFRPLLMRINVREDEYRGETKIRYTMARAEPLDFAAEARVLLDEIESYD